MSSTPASTLLVAILAGVAGGGASALAFASRDAAPSDQAHAPHDNRRGPAPTELQPRPTARREPSAPTRTEGPPHAADTRGGEQPTAEVPLDIEQIVHLEQQQLHQDLEAHDREPSDHAWASATERSLTDDGRAVAAENGFEHVRTSCRSETCVVTYRWRTRQEAEQSFVTAVHHGYEANCARTFTLPEGDARPFEASMVLRCR